jgi:hypothetical protein
MTLPTDDAPALLCPACGFDLRATTSDRCGECGLTFDRALLTVSGIPWAHRRTMGRIRAYFKTLWQITLDSKSIRHEASKPQELSDARSFRRVNACLVAVAFLAALGTALYMGGGLVILAIQPPSTLGFIGMSSGGKTIDPHWYDLAVPWSAGATIAPVLPICLIMLAFWLTGAQRFIFRVPASSPPNQQQRALCLSHYAAAPLVYLLAVVALLISAALIAKAIELDETKPIPAFILILTIGATAIFLAAIIATFLRTAKWLMRTRHCSAGAAALALGELIGLWTLGAVVLVGLIPWSVGFLWIVIDSLR